MSSISVKTPDYNPWFSASQIDELFLAKKGIPSKRASQEGQNGTTFIFIACSCEQQKDHKERTQFRSKRLTTVHGVWPKLLTLAENYTVLNHISRGTGKHNNKLF